MNDYTIRILHKTNRFKDCDDIKVFIDGVEIKKIKNTFKYIAYEGKHILRIEQVRCYKSKYSYVLIPFYFFDISLLDNSPFYAIYETEFYLDKDLNINVTLDKEYIKPKRFIKIKNCRFNVVFDNGVKNNLLKNDFIATEKERKHWLLLNIIVITFPITLLSIFTIKSINIYEPIINPIFFIAIIIILILALIFLVSNCYVNYNNDKYNKQF